MHMAAIALVAIGRGTACLNGETLPGAVALERAGLAPYVLQPKDGLSMTALTAPPLAPARWPCLMPSAWPIWPMWPVR